MVAIITQYHIFPVLTVSTFSAKGWVRLVESGDIGVFILNGETPWGNIFHLFPDAATIATLELHVPRRSDFGDLQNVWVGCDVQGTFGLPFDVDELPGVVSYFGSVRTIMYLEVVVSVALLSDGKVAHC